MANEKPAVKMNIYQKMSKAKAIIQGQISSKSGKNTFSNFSYFELQDFLPVMNKVFDEIGLFSKFQIVTNRPDEDGIVKELATVTIVNTENPEEKLNYSSDTAECGIKGATEIQNLGGKHTYMRRYMYTEILDLAVPDTVDSQKKEDLQPTPTVRMATKAQVAKIASADPVRVQKMMAFYKVDSLEKLTAEQASMAIKQLNKPEAKPEVKEENNGTGTGE